MLPDKKMLNIELLLLPMTLPVSLLLHIIARYRTTAAVLPNNSKKKCSIRNGRRAGAAESYTMVYTFVFILS